MKRTYLWAALLIVAVVGFMLGRATVSMHLDRIAAARHGDIPLFPAPPPHDDTKPAESTDTNAAQPSDIIIESPAEGTALIDALIDVVGRAKIAGGSLRITVKDSTGAPIASAEAPIRAEGDAEFGRFGYTFSFAAKPSGMATVEVGRVSGEGGTAIKHVTFGEAAATVKVYFHNSSLGAADECTGVFPVVRAAPSGMSANRAALQELLKGPTADERAKGYTSALPVSAAVKSVTIDAQGKVLADFNDAMNRGVAGSCRVGAIRAQIETTLRQFPETRSVVISVNGKTDDVLQP